jgi:Ca-activated chloride channel family protein
MKSNNDSEDIIIEVTPSSPYALATGETHLYIQLKLIGKEIKTENLRTNLNLGVVLDRSGSMHGSKLQKAKEAVEFIVNNLTNEDVFALTVYDHRVNTIIPSAKLANRTSIINKLRSVRDRGRTNLHGGLMEGVKQVESTKHLEYRNITLLLSDGLANEGITDRSRIRESVKLTYEGGIGISTFGVGDDFDEDLLVNIADAAGGSFYFIETADDIPKFIEQEFKGLLATSVYNVEVSWENLEGIKLQRVLGAPYEDRLSSSTKLGDLRSGNELIVILDVILPPSDEQESEIVTFDIKWIPRSGPTVPNHVNTTCRIKYTTNEEELTTENDQVLENVHLLEAALVQYEAMALADQGDFSGAQNTMQAFQTKLEHRLSHSPSPELEQLQKASKSMMDDVLHKEGYSKLGRKKLRSSMYSLRKKR